MDSSPPPDEAGASSPATSSRRGAASSSSGGGCSAPAATQWRWTAEQDRLLAELVGGHSRGVDWIGLAKLALGAAWDPAAEAEAAKAVKARCVDLGVAKLRINCRKPPWSEEEEVVLAGRGWGRVLAWPLVPTYLHV